MVEFIVKTKKNQLAALGLGLLALILIPIVVVFTGIFLRAFLA